MPSIVLVLFLVAAGDANESSTCPCAACQIQKDGKTPVVATQLSFAAAQPIAATNRFVVRSDSRPVDANALAQHAEHLHTTLVKRWFKSDDEATWTPRCEIIVHATRANYVRAVGASGANTLGSTLVRFNAGKVAARRIDLLADQAGRPFETVGHELVHVLFAERFPKSPPPRWAEEGAALLVDSNAKRAAHRRDFAQSLRAGSAFHVNDLVRMHDYPPPTRFAAFYGQSLVLVDFLTQLGETEDFVRFVDRSMTVGHDRALQEVYGIATAAELESLWKEKAVQQALAMQ